MRMNRYAASFTIVLVVLPQIIAKPVRTIMRKASEETPSSRYTSVKTHELQKDAWPHNFGRTQKSTEIQHSQHASIANKLDPYRVLMSNSVCTGLRAKLDLPQVTLESTSQESPESGLISTLERKVKLLQESPELFPDLLEETMTKLKQEKAKSGQICKGPFTAKENQSAPGKIALVIRGESFRRNSGVQDRDIYVTDETQQCQLSASESHVKYLIKPLEACGIKVDVFLISWLPEGAKASKATELMKSVYHPRIVKSEWHNRSDPVSSLLDAEAVDRQADNYVSALRAVAGSHDRYDAHDALRDSYAATSLLDGRAVDGQADNYMKALRAVAGSHDTYDALIVVRADLEFKRSLVDLPNADWSKVLFPFHMWEKGGGYPTDKIEQFVPDTIFWFPWKFMNCAYTLGWKGEYSAFINDLIGLGNTNYMMPDEFHGDNSETDWNPLYAQACRKRQVFDVHGGHVFAMFNVMEIKDAEEAQMAGDTFRSEMFFQGDPRTLPPVAMVMHSWSKQKNVTDRLRLCFGEIPNKEAHESLEESESESSWLVALHSMKRSFELLHNNSDFSFKKHFHPKFMYDRVAFVRLEHHFPSKYISLYELKTQEAVFVMYGAEAYSFVPTLIVLSHEAAWKLGEYLMRELPGFGIQTMWALKRLGVNAWLQQVTGLPVREM